MSNFNFIGSFSKLFNLSASLLELRFRQAVLYFHLKKQLAQSIHGTPKDKCSLTTLHDCSFSRNPATTALFPQTTGDPREASQFSCDVRSASMKRRCTVSCQRTCFQKGTESFWILRIAEIWTVDHNIHEISTLLSSSKKLTRHQRWKA